MCHNGWLLLPTKVIIRFGHLILFLSTKRAVFDILLIKIILCWEYFQMEQWFTVFGNDNKYVLRWNRFKNSFAFRVTLTLSCLMDFRYFPRDKHKCMMDISSCKHLLDIEIKVLIIVLFTDAHTEQHIKYDWREENAILMSKGFKTNVANFELERIRRDDCPIITTTGK